MELLLMIITDIIKFYGCHLTKSALQSHWSRDVSPNVKLLKDAVAQGLEPRDVVLFEGVRPDRAGKG
jgi:hypothetical protein